MTDPEDIPPPPTERELVEIGRRHLYPNYRQPPLILARGRGSWVWDMSGKRYLDFFAGIAVSSLGHGHPALVQAIAQQARQLIHTSNHFFNEHNVRLAERLCLLTRMDRAFFCNSGAEAIEASLKLSRRHFFAQGKAERRRVLAFENSFHGRTLGALAVTGQKKYRDGFGELPDVVHVPFGDLEKVRAAMTEEVAAILVESIQGEGGVVPAPAGFLSGLRKVTDEHGALLIADEIQTGVGRTGRFLGVDHEDVRPDVVVLAKGLGGGVPLGAMLCRESLSTALPPGSHGSTFGGNPLASAAAMAVLETLEQQDLISAARTRGDQLASGLREAQKRHPERIAEVRGRGLLQALVPAEDLEPRELLVKLRHAGLLLTVAGERALRFSPPLIVSDQEIGQALSILDQVLSDLH